MVGARGFDPQEAAGPPTILCTPYDNLVGARGFDPQEAAGPPTILCTPDSNLVGARGFEPPTLCTPCRCATRLRYAPMIRTES
jgi:hypothetical protein